MIHSVSDLNLSDTYHNGSFIEHIDEVRENSAGVTTMTLMVNIAGAGILFLPLAMHQASIAVGVGMIVLFAWLTIETADLVVLGCEVTGAGSLPDIVAMAIIGVPQPVPAYEEITADATPTKHHTRVLRRLLADTEARRQSLRNHVTLLLDMMVTMYLIGLLAMYIQIVVDNLTNIAIVLKLPHAWHNPARYYALLFFVMLAIGTRRQMSELKWAGAAAMTSLLAMVGAVVLEYGFFTRHDGHVYKQGVKWLEWTPEFVAALPTMTIALGYHYSIPNLYRPLRDRNPAMFRDLVFRATVFCTTLYILLGVIGYLTFGPDVARSFANGNVLNLYRRDDTVITVLRLGLAVHILTVFPVMAISVRDSFHRGSLRLFGEHELAGQADLMAIADRGAILVEAAIVCGIVVAAAMNQFQVGTYINFFGTVFGVFIIFIAPAIVGIAVANEIARGHPEITIDRMSAIHFESVFERSHVIKCWSIIVLGVIAIVLGVLSLLGYLPS